MSEPRPDGLDELDRRGRAAATALRERVDALVDDDAAPAPWTATVRRDGDGPRVARPPGSLPGTTPPPAHGLGAGGDHHLPAAVDPTSRRGLRGRMDGPARWLAVAAVAALVAGVAAIVVREPRPGVNSGQPGYLVPERAPAGMELAHAAVLDGSGAADAVRADIAVYGDPGAADPWAGPVLSVFRQRDVDDTSTPAMNEPAAAVTIEVDGHEAVLRPATSGSGAGADEAWQVEWTDADDRVLVSGGQGVTRDEVTAAAGAVDDDEIAADGLPDGFVSLAEGPLDSAVDPMALVSLPYTSGLVVTYRPPGSADDGPFVGVLQRPGSAESVDLLRFAFPDSEAIEVRGHHAVVGRRDGHAAVQWLEPDGQLVTVWGAGVDEDDVLAVAEGLRPASTAEVGELVASGPGPLGPVGAGDVEVASGRTEAGSDWRLVVDPAAPEGLAAVTFEDASGAMSTGALGTSGEEPALEVTTVGLDGDEPAGTGSSLVYGTAAPAATTVVLEAPGRPPVELARHPVDGWSRTVVVLAVPTADLAGASVVARGGDGAELQRTTLG
jgi:hypothetical protein